MGKPKKQSSNNINSSEIDAILDNCMSDVCEIEPSSKGELPDGQLLFVAQFDEGYHFRNLIDYLRMANSEANIVFTRDKITYSCANGIETILNKFTINTVDIPYYFNKVYSDVEVGVQLGNLMRNTKNIGKKDAFKIYMIAGIRKLFYEILSTGNTGMTTQSTGTIDVKRVEGIPSAIDTTFTSEPIHTTSLSSFSHNCTVLSNLKCSKVQITAYDHGLKLEGIDNYEQVQNVQRFYPSKVQLGYNKTDHAPSVTIIKNAIDADIGEKIIKIKVSMVIIKWISKLSNIAPQAARIIIHAEPNKPIRLTGSIGFCGFFEIYINNDQ